jgi:hypothetical protein
MAEDSGAFKTNPRNSARFPAFCNDPAAALHRSLTGLRKRFRPMLQAFTPPIVTNAADMLRYSQTSLIRCALAVSAASRTRPIL